MGGAKVRKEGPPQQISKVIVVAVVATVGADAIISISYAFYHLYY